MTTAMRACRSIIPGLALGLCFPLLLGQAAEEQRGPRRQRGPGGGHGPAGLVRGLFRASPEDQGPLKPGEADELLAFAEQHAPRAYKLLRGLRERDPAQFQEKMAAHAPRLRHLRRIYEQNPQMGAVVQAYADDLVAIERSARSLRAPHGPSPDSPEYAREMDKLRNLVAGNVQRECDALDLIADQYEQERAARLERRVDYLAGDEVNLEGEPPELQKLITAFQSAATEAERATLREQIQTAAARQVDGEVAALRARAARLRGDLTPEVERRVKEALQPSARRGPHRGPR